MLSITLQHWPRRNIPDYDSKNGLVYCQIISRVSLNTMALIGTLRYRDLFTLGTHTFKKHPRISGIRVVQRKTSIGLKSHGGDQLERSGEKTCSRNPHKLTLPTVAKSLKPPVMYHKFSDVDSGD